VVYKKAEVLKPGEGFSVGQLEMGGEEG